MTREHRLASCFYQGQVWSALVEDDKVSLLETGGWTSGRLANLETAGEPQTIEAVVPLPEVRLLRPITDVGRVWCVGHNYRSHIEEMSAPLPQVPTIFGKYDSSLTGPYDPIPDAGSEAGMDWEAELVVVVGRRVRNVPVEKAPQSILGYTIGNDISQRTWQRRTAQWTLGKVADRSTPIGPWVVPAASVAESDGSLDLTVTCDVNGQQVQHGTTGDLLFGPAYLVHYLSQVVTLEPGDLIFTGTPAGVGAASGRRLAAGDVVRTSIERLGTMRNVVEETVAVGTG